MAHRIVIAGSEGERDRCIAIRLEVFVDEQRVPLDMEIDEYEDVAAHFLAVDEETGADLGTARLVVKGKTAKIGRVAVVAKGRGRGIGEALMRAALARSIELGLSEAVLDSQTHAIPFYERLGFVAEGDIFDDAGIPHRLMKKKLS